MWDLLYAYNLPTTCENTSKVGCCYGAKNVKVN